MQERDGFKSQVESLRDKVSGLARELAAGEDGANAAGARAAQLEATASDLEAQLATAKVQIAALEVQVRDSKAQLAVAEDHGSETVRELCLVKKQLADEQSRAQGAEDRAAALQSELEASQQVQLCSPWPHVRLWFHETSVREVARQNAKKCVLARTLKKNCRQTFVTHQGWLKTPQKTWHRSTGTQEARA